MLRTLLGFLALVLAPGLLLAGWVSVLAHPRGILPEAWMGAVGWTGVTFTWISLAFCALALWVSVPAITYWQILITIEGLLLIVPWLDYAPFESWPLLVVAYGVYAVYVAYAWNHPPESRQLFFAKILLIDVPLIVYATGRSLDVTYSFTVQSCGVFLFWIYLGLLIGRLEQDHRWRRLELDAYLYLYPSILVLGIFHVVPVFYALVLSFYRSVSVQTDEFAGFQNFTTLWNDPLFWLTMKNTWYFVLMTVPITIVLSLGIALLLNTSIRGKGVYRTLYFLPVVTSIAAISIVWKWVYNPQWGLLNHALVHGLGFRQFQGYDWLRDDQGIVEALAHRLSLELPAWAPVGPSVAMMAVVVMSVWKGLGYNVVIFLAGLQNIPRELYEVARIDGAGPWQAFRNITWPLLTPTTYFILIITTISSFQVFAQIYMLYDGLPSDSTNVIVFYMYEVGIKNNRFGYGSAIAYVLFLIVFLLTIFQKQVVEKRVHYQ